LLIGKKKLRAMLVVTLLVGGLIGTSAPAAHADRCQPEELVVGAGNGPMAEGDSPICVVLDNYVYPFVCAGGTRPLLSCLQNPNPDPSYRPPLIPYYQPNAFRIYCNAYLWTWDRVGQTATCNY
jgi:hypothetical protein